MSQSNPRCGARGLVHVMAAPGGRGGGQGGVRPAAGAAHPQAGAPNPQVCSLLRSRIPLPSSPVAGTKPPRCCARCLQPGLRGGQQPQGRDTGTRCIAQRQHGAKVPCTACSGGCSPRQMLPPEQQLLGAHSSAQRAPTGPGRWDIRWWGWGTHCQGPRGAVTPPESLPNPAEPGHPALGSSGTPVRLLETSAWGDRAVGSPRPAAQRGAGSAQLHGQLGQRTWAGPAAGPGCGGGPVPEERDRPRAPEPLTQCSLPSLAAAGPRGLGTGCQPGRGV